MSDRAKAKWAEKWGTAVPLSVEGAGSPSNTMLLGLRPTSVPTDILIHPAVWSQYTSVTDRQRLGLVVARWSRSTKLLYAGPGYVNVCGRV